MRAQSLGLATVLLALAGLASAHGSHSNESPSSDWATRHMQGEDRLNRRFARFPDLQNLRANP